MAVQNFKPATEINPNTWYHVTEARVDNHSKPSFGSMLQVSQNGILFVYPTTKNQYWQFQPVDNRPGRYAIRGSKTQIKQLSVCWRHNKIDKTRTQPCIAKSDGSDEQKWDVAEFGNNTFRFVNVKNGSDYYLGVHPGSPVFLSSNIDTAMYQPAQHWLMTSHRPVNDGAFSTVLTNISPAMTFSGTTATVGCAVSGKATSNGSSASDISAGASVAIGIGAGLVVIGLALGAYFVWRRRRRCRSSTPVSCRSESAIGGFSHEKASPVPPYSQAHSPSHIPPSDSEFLPHQEVHSSSAPQEMSAESRHELDTGPSYHHITGREAYGRFGQ